MTATDSLTTAFEELPWLQALAMRLAHGDVAEADDLVQETLVVAWERPQDQPITALRAWLATVLRNRARMRQRATLRRRAREAQGEAPSEPLTPARHLAHLDVLTVLLERVRSLPEPDRQIIVGRFFEGRDASELGRELGMLPATVRSRQKRALERLRTELDEHHAGGRHEWCGAVMLSIPSSTAAATTATTGVALMSHGIKIAAIVTIATTIGIGAWLVKSERPPTEARTGLAEQPSSPRLPAPTDRAPREAAGVGQPRPASPPTPRPGFADELAAAVDQGIEPMIAEANGFASKALDGCTDGDPHGKLGVLTLRSTIVGTPGEGTRIEAVEVLDEQGMADGLVDCMVGAMTESVGREPPHAFRKVETTTILGQAPKELDGEQWRRTMFESVVHAHLADVRGCEVEHGQDASTKGKVAIDMRFAGEPAASDVVITADEAPQGLAECIAEQAGSWLFPRALEGPALSYTFELPIDLELTTTP